MARRQPGRPAEEPPVGRPPKISTLKTALHSAAAPPPPSPLLATAVSPRCFVRFCPVAALPGKNSFSKTFPEFALFHRIIKGQQIIRATLEANGVYASTSDADWNLMWSGPYVKPHVFKALLEHQKINHIPRAYEVTRKDRMYANVMRLAQLHGAEHFDFLPKTFVFPTECFQFGAYVAKQQKDGKSPELWIVKPQALSRGRGIRLITSPDEISPDEQSVVSRYLSAPYLINGLKFDLRVYVLVTCVTPLRIYLYDEGIVRFCTQRYSLSAANVANPFVHLTNYSINKLNTEDQAEDGQDSEEQSAPAASFGSADPSEPQDQTQYKWTLTQFWHYLKSEKGIEKEPVWSRIKDLVAKTFLSVQDEMRTATEMYVPFRNNCFELFGLDVLVDCDLKPWLLEVNLTPSLTCDTPLDLRVKARLISDMLNLVGLTPPVLPPRAKTAAMSTQLRAQYAWSQPHHPATNSVNKSQPPKPRLSKQSSKQPINDCLSSSSSDSNNNNNNSSNTDSNNNNNDDLSDRTVAATVSTTTIATAATTSAATRSTKHPSATPTTAVSTATTTTTAIPASSSAPPPTTTNSAPALSPPAPPSAAFDLARLPSDARAVVRDTQDEFHRMTSTLFQLVLPAAGPPGRPHTYYLDFFASPHPHNAVLLERLPALLSTVD